MDEFECDCDETPSLPAWRLTWVDPIRWVMQGVQLFGQSIDALGCKINEDLVMHSKYMKSREDFASEAGREIEAITAGLTEEK